MFDIYVWGLHKAFSDQTVLGTFWDELSSGELNTLKGFFSVGICTGSGKLLCKQHKLVIGVLMLLLCDSTAQQMKANVTVSLLHTFV